MSKLSWWILPTTADIGLRAFAANPADVVRETTMGMQSILLSETGAKTLPQLVRNSGVWVVKGDGCKHDDLLVRWLEEVLYQAEVDGRWVVDVHPLIKPEGIEAQVSYVDANEVEREVEIKAVTRHELLFKEIAEGSIVSGIDGEIPTFEGPGWMAQVIFDI